MPNRGTKRLGSSSSSKKSKAERKAKKRAAAIAAVDAARHDPLEPRRIVGGVEEVPSSVLASEDPSVSVHSPSPAPSDRLVIDESQPEG